jgi:hypothetical protein
MSNRLNQIVRGMRNLVLLGIVLSVLIACGGPEPTAEVVVVTSTFTPTAAVEVVTATFTPTSVPSDTPEPTDTLEPTDTPEPTDTAIPPTDVPTEAPPLEFFTYEHPSGAFSVDIPTDADYDDDEESLYFTHSDSLIMIFYTILDEPIDQETLESVIPLVLDDSLVGEGLITSYDNVETETSEDGNMVGASFDATSDEYEEGEGILILWQLGRTLYFVILLTPDYDSIEEVWDTAFNSLTAKPMEPEPSPVPPTNTSAPPTATTKPKPKPTATKPPPPQANKGCYLIVNELGADITITFTAQDWQWNETIDLPKGTQKEYCLDPGRYTYTLDAPPPWGSTNGELTVNAGDRFRWPIRGG